MADEPATTAELAPATGGETISKSELKRRLKAAEKEKEKEAKAAAAAAKAAAEPSKPKAAAAAADEESDPTKYYDTRVASIKSWEAAGINAYPHKFVVTKQIPAFVEQYRDIPTHTVLDSETVAVAGRIFAVRSSSSKLQFYDLHGEGAKIQIMANASLASDLAACVCAGAPCCVSPRWLSVAHLLCSYEWVRDNVRRGDIIGVEGHPGKTKLGELSIMPKRMVILTPCLHMLPKSFYGLKDQETRYR
jgi:lysyl-tRNA synthetase, class II